MVSINEKSLCVICVFDHKQHCKKETFNKMNEHWIWGEHYCNFLSMQHNQFTWHTSSNKVDRLRNKCQCLKARSKWDRTAHQQHSYVDMKNTLNAANYILMFLNSWSVYECIMNSKTETRKWLLKTRNVVSWLQIFVVIFFFLFFLTLIFIVSTTISSVTCALVVLWDKVEGTKKTKKNNRKSSERKKKERNG